MKNNELLVITNIKKTILFFDNILLNFPKKDYILHIVYLEKGEIIYENYLQRSRKRIYIS